VIFADQLMYTRLRARDHAPASRSASTTSSSPSRRTQLVDAGHREVKEIEQQYASGLITNGERYNKVVDIWSHAPTIRSPRP
jgi:DNA-directed RNA polymerase subunit beta'